MCNKIVTLKTLSEALKLNSATLRNYLSSYRFASFEDHIGHKIVYKFNKEFIKVLAEYLWLKKQENAINLLKSFYKKNSCK